MSNINLCKSLQAADSIVFDLDGTLWNACSACADGWTLGLKSLGYEKKISKAQIESVCGFTFPDCVRTLCPEISESMIEKAVDVLNNHERMQIEQNGGEIYEGVVEGLKELARIYNLYIVSNCQEWYLHSFLNLSGLKHIFKDWECYGRTLMPKDHNLRILAERNGLVKPLYIGDTESDKIAAEKAKYSFAFASYGFGDVSHDVQLSNFSALVTSR